MLGIQSVYNIYVTRTFPVETIMWPSPGCWSGDNYLPSESKADICDVKSYLVWRFWLKFYEEVFQLIWRVLIIQKEEIKTNRFNWNFNRIAIWFLNVVVTKSNLTNCSPLLSLYPKLHCQNGFFLSKFFSI